MMSLTAAVPCVARASASRPRDAGRGANKSVSQKVRVTRDVPNHGGGVQIVDRVFVTARVHDTHSSMRDASDAGIQKRYRNQRNLPFSSSRPDARGTIHAPE